MVMTDKYENGLITEYELLFLPIHRELLKILEVGVFHGGGLEWLSKYFLNSCMCFALLVKSFFLSFVSLNPEYPKNITSYLFENVFLKLNLLL